MWKLEARRATSRPQAHAHVADKRWRLPTRGCELEAMCTHIAMCADDAMRCTHKPMHIHTWPLHWPYGFGATHAMRRNNGSRIDGRFRERNPMAAFDSPGWLWPHAPIRLTRWRGVAPIAPQAATSPVTASRYNMRPTPPTTTSGSSRRSACRSACCRRKSPANIARSRSSKSCRAPK